LLLCWNLKTFSPEFKLIKITDDEVKDKSSLGFGLTDPPADSEQKDEDLFVYQHSSKHNLAWCHLLVVVF
jgi:hypothetical protein